jgi:hypothetical protein
VILDKVVLRRTYRQFANFPTVLGIVVTVITIATVTPTFLIAFFGLSWIYVLYARMFVTSFLLLLSPCADQFKRYSQTARELRRLDSVSKSPLYSLYGETINGVAVIRGCAWLRVFKTDLLILKPLCSYGAVSRFMHMALERIDTNVCDSVACDSGTRL